MSNYEDQFICDEDEDYDLEYFEDSDSEPYLALKNQFYDSNALKEEDPIATQKFVFVFWRKKIEIGAICWSSYELSKVS